MKKFKVFATLLMSLAVFSCGSNTDTSKEAVKDEKVELKFSAFEGGYGDKVWPEIVKAYEEVNPKASVILTQSKTIEDELTSKIKGGQYPDVVMLATGRKAGLTENFIKEQALENLNDVLNRVVPGEQKKVSEKVEEGFINNGVTKPYGNDDLYLMPIFYSTTGLFYNKTLFEKEGFTVPTTWDEFFMLAKKAKAKGISLFTYATPSYLDSFLPSAIASVYGYEGVNKFYNFDSSIFKGEKGDKLFSILKDLFANTDKTTVSNANAQNYRKNQQLIIDGKSLFIPNGFWVVDEMKDTTPDTMKWGMMALPKLDKDRYAYSFFEQVWIPANAENKEVAKDFVAFLYSDKAAEIFAKYKAVQPINSYPYDKLPKDTQLFFELYKNGAKSIVGGFVPTEPVEGLTIQDEVYSSIDSVVNKTKSIDEYRNNLIKKFDILRKHIIK
ncbi:carbohydrate ABC transporter substrate-binding protein [Oceanivirga miroungae]|uniref:Family 1 extracellular solute-binding protein n=1 Tax=Oceanivirga miroungae TaxID=1130046 RepID=A0A6I8MC38_9FUSO|nr:carbohydrate ABC transporter substrate-binding protein [Oceanivirga miroungae]VWL85020.1 family 1 extracellular solute-binding protein [Oceanivirga miroungae]